MVKYSFEIKKEIKACYQCPLSDDLYNQCNLASVVKQGLVDFKKQFEECPLEVISDGRT